LLRRQALANLGLHFRRLYRRTHLYRTLVFSPEKIRQFRKNSRIFKNNENIHTKLLRSVLQHVCTCKAFL